MNDDYNNNVSYTFTEAGPHPIMTLGHDNTIEFDTNGNSEPMLKITKDGFYVRGVKVPQDEREAEAVYKTFHQWLTWATLNRNY